jgi:hypothetical protein
VRDSTDEALIGCGMSLFVLILGAPITLLSTWVTGATWDWPIIGIGWWSAHPVPDWELRWVVAAVTLAVVSRLS